MGIIFKIGKEVTIYFKHRNLPKYIKETVRDIYFRPKDFDNYLKKIGFELLSNNDLMNNNLKSDEKPNGFNYRNMKIYIKK